MIDHILNGNCSIVERLFKRGQNPFERKTFYCEYTNTAVVRGSYIHAAVISGSPEMVKIMLDHLLNPNDLDDNDKSPLYYAIMLSNDSNVDETLKIVAHLLDYGADPQMILGNPRFKITAKSFLKPPFANESHLVVHRLLGLDLRLP